MGNRLVIEFRKKEEVGTAKIENMSKKCKKIVDRGGYLRYTNQAVGNGARKRALKTDGIYLFARTKKKLLQKKLLQKKVLDKLL